MRSFEEVCGTDRPKTEPSFVRLGFDPFGDLERPVHVVFAEVPEYMGRDTARSAGQLVDASGIVEFLFDVQSRTGRHVIAEPAAAELAENPARYLHLEPLDRFHGGANPLLTELLP